MPFEATNEEEVGFQLHKKTADDSIDDGNLNEDVDEDELNSADRYDVKASHKKINNEENVEMCSEGSSGGGNPLHPTEEQYSVVGTIEDGDGDDNRLSDGLRRSHRRRQPVAMSYQSSNSDVLAREKEWYEGSGRYAHGRAGVYVVFHELGASLRRGEGGAVDTESELHKALALLNAYSPAVRLVGSVGHVDLPLLWDSATLAQFRWSCHNITTYMATRWPSQFTVGVSRPELSKRKRNQGDEEDAEGGIDKADSSYMYIFQSLPERAKETLMMLAVEVNANKMAKMSESKAQKCSTKSSGDTQMSTKDTAHRGSQSATLDRSVDLTALMNRAKDRFRVRCEGDMIGYLRELVDQHIVTLTNAAGGKTIVNVLLPATVIDIICTEASSNPVSSKS